MVYCEDVPLIPDSVKGNEHLIISKCHSHYRIGSLEGGRKVRELFAIVSFVMAVVGGLATMFLKDRDKQTMGSIVAGAFLISFFINVHQEAKLLLQLACLVSFAMAVTGGVVTIFSNEKNRRAGAIGIGIVALGTTLFILFMYLEFRPF